MKPVSQIRRERLAELVAEAGSQVAVAEKLGKDKNQVYQWLLPPESAGARNIGPRSAKAIETAFKKPEGWLDHETDGFSSVREPSPNYDVWQSRLQRPGVAILTKAVKIVATDEALNGVYSFDKHAALLLDLCDRIEAGEDPEVIGMKLIYERKGDGTNGTASTANGHRK